MARKLTIKFQGLCAYVRDRSETRDSERLTVLMLDGTKARVGSTSTNEPELVFPRPAIPGLKPDGADGARSVVSLRGRGVLIQTTGEPRLALADGFHMVPELEEIRRGLGLVDQKCMKDRRPRRIVAARIRVQGGTVTAVPQGEYARKRWRFEPPPGGGDEPQVLADLVTVTLSGRSGPFSLLFTDLRTGKVEREIPIDTSAGATIEFRNEPDDGYGAAHAHHGVNPASWRALHFAVCYEVSARGRRLTKRQRPIPVLVPPAPAAATAASRPLAATSRTVFCPGGSLYEGP